MQTPTPEAPKSVDVALVMEMLTLLEKSAREARETMCVCRQVKVGIEQAKNSVLAAGSAVLAQIANGNGKVIRPGHPEDPAFQQATQMDLFIKQQFQNIYGIAAVLKGHLEQAGAA